MLNTSLDWEKTRQEYEENGFVRIVDILDADHANKIGDALAHNTDWRLCYLSKDGPVCLTMEELNDRTPQQQAELNRDILTRAYSGFSYYYYRHALNSAPNQELHTFYDYVRGESFLEFIRFVTRQQSINTATGQATSYRPSCFLRRHNDTTDKENRAAAYVFGFTREWQADWGGLLNIQDESRNIVATHIPAFNTLTLFKVPQYHFVSQIANYAQGARYTTTGWFLTP